MDSTFNNGFSNSVMEDHTSYKKYLIITVIYLLLCGCCCGTSLFLGIPAFICVILGNRRFKENRLEAAEKLFLAVKILLIVGVIVSCLFGILELIFIILRGVFGAVGAMLF